MGENSRTLRPWPPAGTWYPRSSKTCPHLLKWVDWQQDTEGRDLELRYFRDKDGREVDFPVLEGRRPVLMVEAKLGDDEVERGLRALRRRFPGCPAWQVHATGTKDYRTPDGIRVAPAVVLLRTLVRSGRCGWANSSRSAGAARSRTGARTLEAVGGLAPSSPLSHSPAGLPPPFARGREMARCYESGQLH